MLFLGHTLEPEVRLSEWRTAAHNVLSLTDVCISAGLLPGYSRQVARQTRGQQQIREPEDEQGTV